MLIKEHPVRMPLLGKFLWHRRPQKIISPDTASGKFDDFIVEGMCHLELVDCGEHQLFM
jgi:hypothetical protein